MGIPLLVLICIFATLLMGGTINKSLEEGFSELQQKVWSIVFPFYCLSIVFIVVSIFIPEPGDFINGFRDISIAFYLFATMLFGISHFILKKRIKSQVEVMNG